MTYRRADDELFGKYCYIDTPWIAGKHTIYRIIRSGVRSNSWCEVPINGLTKKVNHGELTEDIVFVILDTLIDEDAEIMRVALKDIEIIGEAEQTESTGYKMKPVEQTEPQTKCYLRTSCDHYGDKQVCGRCREYNLYSHTKDEPHTEITAQDYERWLFKEPQTEDAYAYDEDDWYDKVERGE